MALTIFFKMKVRRYSCYYSFGTMECPLAHEKFSTQIQFRRLTAECKKYHDKCSCWHCRRSFTNKYSLLRHNLSCPYVRACKCGKVFLRLHVQQFLDHSRLCERPDLTALFQ